LNSFFVQVNHGVCNKSNTKGAISIITSLCFVH
jgi:hypothetical protein